MTDPITTPAQMREAAARLIDDRCADILSKQDGKIPEVDQNLRIMAAILPDLAAEIRALPVAEPAPVAVTVKPLVAGRHPRGFIATDHGGGAAYIFALNGGRYECIKGLAHSPRFDTSKEALAAAEADHAARVRSQIEAVSVAQVRAEALREVLADDEMCLRLAEGYDREDAAQRGEPTPHSMGDEGYAEWAADRIACAKEGLRAIRALIEREPT